MATISALKSDRVGSIRHPLGGGERERQLRLFERNAALAAQYGDNRRGFYAAMAAMTPIAAGVSFAEVKEATVTGWWATPVTDRKDRVILFIHGGGYHLGDAASYRGLGSHVAALTHCPVFLMDYPLAPEHRFPAAYDAAIRARDWLAVSGIERLALVGDSAGGGLALAIQNEPMPKASLACTCVFSPWTDLAFTGDSFKDPNMHDPVFKPEVLAGLANSYLDGANPRDGRHPPCSVFPMTCRHSTFRSAATNCFSMIRKATRNLQRKRGLRSVSMSSRACITSFKGMWASSRPQQSRLDLRRISSTSIGDQTIGVEGSPAAPESACGGRSR